MSTEAQSGRLLKGAIVGQVALWFLAPLVALVALLGYQMFGGKGIIVEPPPGPLKGSEENFLAQTRTTLGKKTDLATCRSVVQDLNAHLQLSPEHAVTPLPPAEAEQLSKLLVLDPGDLAEVNSTTFTPLDAFHLEACLLLRDAARTLEVQAVEAGGKPFRQSPLDRATAAFAWVCRQVRLEVPGMEGLTETPPPVTQVLRLGRGGPVERALVFLALLEQFGLDDEDTSGLQGCLVLTRDEKEQINFWCCGVTIGTKADAVYLFDPRLGLPVPGPGGKGIATLAQAQQDPGVLGQLKIDKLAYEVTPQMAKRVTLSLVCPLSAVAPRMHLLQDRLLRERVWRQQALPPAIRLRLAEHPLKAQASLQAAVGSSDTCKVTLSPAGATILRRFVPKEEGGSDEPASVEVRRIFGFAQPDDPARARLGRQQVFNFQAVPWTDLPKVFQQAAEFRMDNPLGDRLRRMFMAPFLRNLIDPNSPRNLVIRGSYGRAVKEFVPEQDQWTAMRRRLEAAGDLTPGVVEWTTKRAMPATAAALRARGTPDERPANAALDEVWRWKQGDPMEVLLFGAIAGPLSAEAMYQLALCKHEQAQRYQARVELGTKAGIPPGSDAINAQKTWAEAEGFWKEYLVEHAGRPGVASARRLLGEAQAMLGQREQAVKTLEDASAAMTDMEKLASLWQAKQLAGGKGS